MPIPHAGTRSKHYALPREHCRIAVLANRLHLISRGGNQRPKFKTAPAAGLVAESIRPPLAQHLRFMEHSTGVHNRARSKTFLIAESEAAVISTIRHALEPEGHSILTVFTAETALEVFESRKDEIGFVITRITLPGLSGIELLERARAIKPHLCHLVISHYDIDLLRLIPGFQKYRANFLPKPFTAEALLTKVKAQLSGSRE